MRLSEVPRCSGILYRFGFLAIYVLSLIGTSSCWSRIKDSIYVELHDNHACFRILNGTHEVGCQSSRDGSSGVVHLVENADDVDYILRDSGGHAPFVAAMSLPAFENPTFVTKLVNSKKLNGMLVLAPNDTDMFASQYAFSEDQSCPNPAFDMYINSEYSNECRNKPWNKPASAYRFMDFDIPIFLINSLSEIDIIVEKCYKGFNVPDKGTPPAYPLCSVQLTMFNIAAGSAVTCLRRNNLIMGLDLGTRNCDPLGDYNAYALVPPLKKLETLQPSSIMLLAARMDSFSMFADYDPGSASALGNVVLLLTIAEALGRNREFIATGSAKTKRRVMPVLFHGESLDYIGSSRMVWDMTNNRFPFAPAAPAKTHPSLITLDTIASILEFNQVAMPNQFYYFHVDPISTRNASVKNQVETMATNLWKNSENAIKKDIDWKLILPPSSVQSFLKANNKIPSLVISDHERAYENRFYNSFLDAPYQIDRTSMEPLMTNLSNAVVRYILQWVSNDDKLPDNWDINVDVMSSLMDCFWSWPRWKCDMFDQIVRSSSPQSESRFIYKRTYVGPQRTSGVRLFSSSLLAYFLGERFENDNASVPCSSYEKQRNDTIENAYFMLDLLNGQSNTSYCYISGVNVSVARSPAFEIEGYDFTSGNYSTWVESVWTGTNLRVFLRADPSWEGRVFAMGILVFVLSFIFVYIITTGSDVLFLPDVVTI